MVNADGTAEIPAVGPIPHETLERLCCDADLTGLLFSGDGQVLRHGETVRTATPAQWRALITRDRGCVGCGMAPQFCQAHHTVPFARSNRSVIDELALVCHKCHRLVHEGHWRTIWNPMKGRWEFKPPERGSPVAAAA